MIFLAIIFPLIASIILYFIRGWELKWYGIYFICTVPTTLIVSGLCYLAGTYQDSFNEVWNYKMVKVQYYEPWNEKVPCRHPIYRTEYYTDTESYYDGKQTRTRTVTKSRQVYVGDEHPYDVDYHPADWDAQDEYNKTWNINEDIYHHWKKKWGNDRFVELNRHYHSIDGNLYESIYPGGFDLIYPKEEVRSYQNKIRVSNSVFKYKEVDKATREKYFRPVDKNAEMAIVSYDNTPFLDGENWTMRRINAELGPKHKIHTVTVLWNANTASEIMNDVLAAWGGPNKNELVIAIGVDSERKVIWCQVYSWCDDTTIHSIVRQDVNAMGKLDFYKMKDILAKQVPQYWHKKSFKDFNYIDNPLPLWAYIIDVIFVLAATVGMYIVVEKYEPTDTHWAI